MQIRIVKRPRGEAPDDIRDAWIGLLLPVVPEHSTPVEGRGWGARSTPRTRFARLLLPLFGRPRLAVRGYLVDIAVAVQILDGAHPSAAAWWRTNTPHLLKPGMTFVFEEECCVVETAA
jgi:hypothetical protein